jgi:hypothetical protein
VHLVSLEVPQRQATFASFIHKSNPDGTQEVSSTIAVGALVFELVVGLDEPEKSETMNPNINKNPINFKIFNLVCSFGLCYLHAFNIDLPTVSG